MKIVTIDFETYYDKDFSLSKMTTEEYIRSPQFEAICVGVKVGNQPTDVFAGNELGTLLKSMDYSDKAVLCHNTAFDGAILSWRYGIKPAMWLDTLSMARALHNVTVGGSLAKLVKHYGLGEKGTEVVNALGKRAADFSSEELSKYASYCANDVDLTYKLFKVMSKGFPLSELRLIDVVIRCYTEPMIELNGGALADNLIRIAAQKQALIEKIAGGDEERFRKVLSSNPMFARLLELLGVDPPMKTSKETGALTYAFAKNDEAFMALQDHPDPKIQAVMAARLGVKSTIQETRTKSFIAVSERGRLPIMLNYYGARTGRFSGGDGLNLQNLPKRGGDKTLRKAMCAPKGYKIIGCDSAQIEARIVAAVAGETDLVAAFRDKRDVYSEFASMVFGRTVTKETDELARHVGKTAVLGLGYGMGAEKFQMTLKMGHPSVDLDLDECQRIVKMYRSKYSMINGLWNRCGNALNRMIADDPGHIHLAVAFDKEGFILPNGLRIQYPGLHPTNSGFAYYSNSRDYAKHLKGDEAKVTYLYGAKAVENVVQGLAALVIREQMVAAHQAGLKVVLQVHDEIVIVAPESEAEAALKTLQTIMSAPPAWMPALPLACEGKIADNYGGV